MAENNSENKFVVSREGENIFIYISTALFILLILTLKFNYSISNYQLETYLPYYKISLNWIFVFIIAIVISIGYFIFLLFYHKMEMSKVFNELTWGLKLVYVSIIGGLVIFLISLPIGKLVGQLLVLIFNNFLNPIPVWIQYSFFMFIPFLAAGLWAGYKMKIDGFTWGVVVSSVIIFFLILSDKNVKIISGPFYEYGAKIYILLSCFSALGSKIFTRKNDFLQKKHREAEEAKFKEEKKEEASTPVKSKRRRKRK